MGNLLVIDGGRSRCRAAVFTAGGTMSDYGEGPGLPPTSDPDAAAAAAAAAVALSGAPLVGVEAACAGLAGVLSSSSVASETARLLSGRLGVERVLVTGDVVTAHAGALGGQPGVVVVAGTGAVALALSGTGTVARADGCGHLLGDAGSGYWIGRAGLEAALRATDGRDGGSLNLARRAEAHLGPLRLLPARLAASPK
ncbi:MAG: BadF/BadG/BcrA/BcrD ATPase family protein, partial [Acidimicrobiia bacterium]